MAAENLLDYIPFLRKRNEIIENLGKEKPVSYDIAKKYGFREHGILREVELLRPFKDIIIVLKETAPGSRMYIRNES